MPKTLNDATEAVLLDADFVVGTESGNKISVTVTIKDRLNGTPVQQVLTLPFYLADAANGSSAAVAPDGGAATETNSGELIEHTANIAGLLITNSSGQAMVSLTESSTGTWYLVIVMPDGKLAISGAITFT